MKLLEYLDEVKTKRETNLTTIPTSIKKEKDINVFIRVNKKHLQYKYNINDEVKLLKKFRDLKDIF